MRQIRIIFSLIFFIFITGTLRAEVVDSKICQQDEAFPVYLQDLSDKYFAQDDYDGFCQHLGQLLQETACSASSDVYYYRALSRYKEISHWKKIKNWEGVYDKAAEYKKEILQDLDRAQSLVKDNAMLSLEILYLQWQNIREDEPDRISIIFKDLSDQAENLQSTAAAMEKIKQIGDELALFEDKSYSRKFYDIYFKKLKDAQLSPEELKLKGEDFLSESNLYLAKVIFNMYLEKISADKMFVAKEIVAIANKFAYQDDGVGLDPFYAEEQYKKSYDMAGIGAYDVDSQYRRAFNQERMREYQAAFNEYRNLIINFSDLPVKHKIYFRMGVLAAYGLKDAELASIYFYKTTQSAASDALSLSGFYQLGLLKQWKAIRSKIEEERASEENKAKEFYNEVLEKVQSLGLDAEKNEIAVMTKDRLNEILDKKEMQYGLKLFLEGIFGLSQDQLILTVDLVALPPKTTVSQLVHFAVTSSNPQTGCMMPVYSYEWSGETGSTVNIPNAPELNTDYSEQGIKVTNIAVVGSKGLEGAGFDMTEIN